MLGNRCVFYTEDCGGKCVRGDPGCCCKSDDTCTQVQRKRLDAVASTEFVYVNSCNKDKVCTVNALPASNVAPQTKRCGVRAVGDMWMENGRTCRCSAGGAVCDAADCFGLITQKECNGNGEICVWGTLPAIGAGCFNRADNAMLGKGVGKEGDACTSSKSCDVGKCSEDTLACPGGMVSVSTMTISSAATLFASFQLLVGMLVALNL